MRSISIILLVLMTACTSKYKTDSFDPPSEPFASSGSVYVMQARDGAYGARTYPGSGHTVSRLLYGAVLNHVSHAELATKIESRKEALDDAISATKAAVEEGIVPGGGLALLRCTGAIEAASQSAEGDVRTGLQILSHALAAPARQIADNSAVDGGVVVARMLEGEGAYGFDASKNEYVDLIEAGIVDPTQVVRIALQNAVSVAGILMLTEATMTEIEEEKDQAQNRMMQPEL